MSKNSQTKIIFISISILYAAGNFIWWQINTPVIPFAIAARHFLDIFEKGYLFYNAPFMTYITRFFFFLFGKEYFDLIIILINYIFFLISLYFIYKIGNELKDKETGNIAMLLFALVPAIYGMSRQYGHQDYHIIAPLTFNIYCLIKAEHFKNRKWSLLYGISVGVGLMIKDTFSSYFFPPFAIILVQSLRKNFKTSTIINVLIAVSSACLISGWHYFRFLIFRKLVNEPITDPGAPVFSFESLRVMTIGLWDELLSPPIFLLFLIGLVWFIAKYKSYYKYPFIFYMLVPWTVIMFMPQQKYSEFAAACIPIMILISALFISNIRKETVKKIIIIVTVCIGMLQYIDFSYGIDTKLFNSGFKYKKHRISYYNKKNQAIISYNNKRDILKIQVRDYLKENYPDANILIKELSNDTVDNLSFISWMYLNNFKVVNDDLFNFPQVQDIDIIVSTHKSMTPDELISSRMHFLCTTFQEDVNASNRIYLLEQLKILKQREKEISDNFTEIKSFSHIKNDPQQIIISARKSELNTK
ncbi:MAG: glycosyltransferase family 39 protein [Endomicrobiaceae bacterium]